MRALREKHRIIGSPIGFTPKTFNINLPFILMPVEIQLLKEKKIIKLYKVDSSEPPSQDKISRLVLESYWSGSAYLVFLGLLITRSRAIRPRLTSSKRRG